MLPETTQGNILNVNKGGFNCTAVQYSHILENVTNFVSESLFYLMKKVVFGSFKVGYLCKM
jgi:hypothetical protein